MGYKAPVFPIRDDNPTLRASVATFLVVAANVIVWVFVQGLGMGPRLTESVWRFGVIPGELLGYVGPGTRVPAGDHLVAILDGVPNWWSILTSMFMHGGWLHLIGNMWYLWIFGDNVEGRLGHVRFLMFYLLCGGIACLAHSIVHVDSAVPLVGASGAIAGVLGAYLMTWPKAKVLTWVPVIVVGYFIEFPAIVLLGLWFLMQLLNETLALAGPAEVQSVAWMAHIGGFVAGMALVRLMRKGRW